MRAVGIVHTGSPTLKSAFDAKVSRCLPFRNNWVVLLFLAGVTVETLCWANLVVCRGGDQVCKSVMNRTETNKKKAQKQHVPSFRDAPRKKEST